MSWQILKSCFLPVAGVNNCILTMYISPNVVNVIFKVFLLSFNFCDNFLHSHRNITKLFLKHTRIDKQNIRRGFQLLWYPGNKIKIVCQSPLTPILNVQLRSHGLCIYQAVGRTAVAIETSLKNLNSCYCNSFAIKFQLIQFVN